MIQINILGTEVPEKGFGRVKGSPSPKTFLWHAMVLKLTLSSFNAVENKALNKGVLMGKNIKNNKVRKAIGATAKMP